MSEDLNQADVVGAEPRRDPEILMESGSISLAGHDNGDACGECSVSRGMHAISADGQEVGWVAAVMLDRGGESRAVLMARPQTTIQYYLLPPHLISRVKDGQVLLRVSAGAVASLPRRQMT